MELIERVHSYPGNNFPVLFYPYDGRLWIPFSHISGLLGLSSPQPLYRYFQVDHLASEFFTRNITYLRINGGRATICGTVLVMLAVLFRRRADPEAYKVASWLWELTVGESAVTPSGMEVLNDG